MDAKAVAALKRFPACRCKKGDVIIRQGEPVRRVFFLAAGSVVRSGLTSRGDELTYGERVADESASCLLGALALYSSACIHDTNFIAETDCVCHAIPADSFKAFLYDNPAVMDDLLHVAIESYEVLNANFRGKMKGLAPSRVATYLLRHATQADGELIYPAKLNITAIARDLGIHRLTVGKIIRALADEEVVAYRGNSLAVVAPERLKNYADGLSELRYRDK